MNLLEKRLLEKFKSNKDTVEEVMKIIGSVCQHCFNTDENDSCYCVRDD